MNSVRQLGVKLGLGGELRPLFCALRDARRASRGVTLVEVLIVVAIIAMIAGGVTVFALPRYREAQVKTATAGAQTVRSAVHQWQAVNNEVSCPSVSQLVEDKMLDPSGGTEDPWGEGYTINCVEDEVIVSSPGPDKKKGSQDDIRVPKGASLDEEDEG